MTVVTERVVILVASNGIMTIAMVIIMVFMAVAMTIFEPTEILLQKGLALQKP